MLVFWQRKLVLSRLPNPYDIDKPLQKANLFKHHVLTLDTRNGRLLHNFMQRQGELPLLCGTSYRQGISRWNASSSWST